MDDIRPRISSVLQTDSRAGGCRGQLRVQLYTHCPSTRLGRMGRSSGGARVHLDGSSSRKEKTGLESRDFVFLRSASACIKLDSVDQRDPCGTVSIYTRFRCSTPGRYRMGRPSKQPPAVPAWSWDPGYCH